MNVADLKINNLVEYKNQIYNITEIFQDNNEKDYFVKIENDIHSFSVPAESIMPIDITEECWKNSVFPEHTLLNSESDMNGRKLLSNTILT